MGECSPRYTGCPAEGMEDDHQDVEGSQSGSDGKSGGNDDHSECGITTDACSDISANKEDSESCAEEEGGFSNGSDEMSDDGKEGYDSGSDDDPSDAEEEGFMDKKVRWCLFFFAFNMCQFRTHQRKQ